MKKVIILLVLMFMAVCANAEQTILVKAKEGRGDALIALHRKHNAKSQKLEHVKNWEIVKIADDINIQDVINEYQKHPSVDIVEKDQEVSILETVPNDPELPNLWGMKAIQSTKAWDISTGNPEVVVAVIDTGIDFNHEDLKANLWTGPNGEHGYTYKGGVLAGDGTDDNGHGTHVAGTIGGVGNNSIGVVGVNWNVKLLAIKFLGSTGGGSTSDAVLGINKLIELKKAGVNIRVTNNSWGGGGYSQSVKNAFDAASAEGIIHAIASGNGNSNTDVTPHYPGSYNSEGIISVQSSKLDVSGEATSAFSNYGVANTDLTAPGSNILSAKMGGGYVSFSGTSMATPHVAGALALLIAHRPELTVKQLRDTILHPDSLDPFPTSKGLYSTTQGRLNLYKLLTNTNVMENYPPTIATNPAPIIITTGDSYAISSSLFEDLNNDELYTSIGNKASNPIDYVFLVTQTTSNGLYKTKPMNVSLVSRPTVSAADGHGGGVISLATIYALKNQSVALNQPPSISVNFTNEPTRMVGTVTKNDPDGDMVWYGYSNLTWFDCCNQFTTSVFLTTNNTYRMTFWGADSAGNVAEAVGVSKPSAITNNPPNVRINERYTVGTAPLTVSFTVSVSDPDGDAIGSLTTGDGESPGFVMGRTAWTYTYTKPGIYMPKAYASDKGFPTGYCSDAAIVVVLPENVEPPPAQCGDGSCNGTETCSTCPVDCGTCPPPPPSCGDGSCNGTETCLTCPTDCGTCPPPPPSCGDGSCNGTETCSTCPTDCGACPPNTPPTAPVNLNISTRGVNSTLTWTESQDSDGYIVGYNVYVNGEILAFVSGTSYRTKRIAAGTYYVKAVDDDGAEGPASNSLIVK